MLAPTPELLAPGDERSRSLDPAQFEWHCVRSVEDPRFSEAYDALWAEFGAANELESRSVLTGRFAMGLSMRYEIVLASANATIAAVRDHTAVWFEGEIVVHLSHVWIAPPWRRSGLAGWMRAAPVASAREVALSRGEPDPPIVLVAEMEYDAPTDPRRRIRLAAYEKAGFRKVTPARLNYHQPDFRTPGQIDASGGARPLPFQLVIRQVGREHETTITGDRLRKIVRALYHMYGAQFRQRDMAHPLLQLDTYPAMEECVDLIPPTA